MPVILPPAALTNPERPPTYWFINNIENICTEYVRLWGKLPEYIYLNQSLWNEIGEQLLPTLDTWRLTPVTHHGIPYQRIHVHTEYIPAGDIAQWSRSFSDEEGEDSGKLEVV